MKPTSTNLEKRLEALENWPEVAPDEPLLIRVVETAPAGSQGERVTRRDVITHPNGQTTIVEEVML
jgi:hypothetical protein